MTTYRYKLTDSQGYTRNSTEWGPGKSYSADGLGPLCTHHWLHCYTNPLLAVFLNPIHADIKNPRLCLVAVSGRHKSDRGLKEGWEQMTFIRWMKLPVINQVQRAAFGILCAKEVYKNRNWQQWADKWLSGENRNIDDAADAYDDADATADAAYYAADATAAYYAASIDDAYYAANTAYYAANAADAAADAADSQLDLVAIAKQTTKIK